MSLDEIRRWDVAHVWHPFTQMAEYAASDPLVVVAAEGHYLIDDRARHFARFTGAPLLFSAPHNAAETRYPRVASWAEVRDYFARLESRGARSAAGRAQSNLLGPAAAAPVQD